MKPLVHGEVCDEHTTHQVWPRPGGQCLDAVVPIPCKVQVPQRLCPRFLTDELRASLAVLILAPGASRANLRFEFHRMVVFLADTADNSPVPPVPVPPLCKDGGAALELNVSKPTDGRASYVCIDDKSSNGIAGSAERDIRRHPVK